MRNLKQYYFSVDEATSTCMELCELKDDGCKIGSIRCQNCVENEGFDREEQWIKCTELEKATGKQ